MVSFLCTLSVILTCMLGTATAPCLKCYCAGREKQFSTAVYYYRRLDIKSFGYVLKRIHYDLPMKLNYSMV